MIILLFGQPASGKTTLADRFHKMMPIIEGLISIRIDGDKWRDVTKNKDYSKEGRLVNLKGAFNMALYLEKDGYVPILSFVTPYEELRSYLKENANKLALIHLTYDGDRGRNNNFAKDFEETDMECLKLNTSEIEEKECVEIIKNYIKSI